MLKEKAYDNFYKIKDNEEYMMDKLNNIYNKDIPIEDKIKEGFELREVCGEYIVVAHGDKNIDFSKVINLNESAAAMWKAVAGKEFTVETLTSILLDTYDVESSIAQADAARIMEEWKEIGLAE